MGEIVPVSHMFENLVLSKKEKETLFGKIINCHSLMTVIDSTEDFDSYMIEEEDIWNSNSFNYSSFMAG